MAKRAQNTPKGGSKICFLQGKSSVPDKTKTLYDGVKAFGSSTLKKGDTMARMYFESIGRHYGIDIKGKPIKKLPREFLEKILYGTGDEEIDFEYSSAAGTRKARKLSVRRTPVS